MSEPQHTPVRAPLGIGEKRLALLREIFDSGGLPRNKIPTRNLLPALVARGFVTYDLESDSYVLTPSGKELIGERPPPERTVSPELSAAWAAHLGIDPEDDRALCPNLYGWPHAFSYFRAGWEARGTGDLP